MVLISMQMYSFTITFFIMFNLSIYLPSNKKIEPVSTV